MHPIFAVPAVFPHEYIGSWRLTFIAMFPDAPEKQECVRTYFDIFEV